MITAASKADRWRAALHLFRSFCEAGGRPNVVTYNALVSFLSSHRLPTSPYTRAVQCCAGAGVEGHACSGSISCGGLLGLRATLLRSKVNRLQLHLDGIPT